nr:hypothetical protein Itr_chr01CG16960 [Ipomoea trifida]
MTSENHCIIEDVDNACVEMPSDEIGVKEHDNFCDEPYDDSFDHNCGDAYIENVVGNVDCVVDDVHANPLENVGDINAKHDDENCFDTCENNSFNSNDNDGLESFTFDDNSLINEHVGELHDMLCNVDDELNVDASLLDLNDVEFDTFHDNCLDDAIYIHDLLGEEKEETDGDLRDVLLSSEKEEEKESVTIEKENEEENFENKNVMIEEVHCKIIEEEKEKTRNESVEEEVEEKGRNDEKEFGDEDTLLTVCISKGRLAIERGQGGNDETAKAGSDAKWGPGRQLVICESNQREDLERGKVMMGNGFGSVWEQEFIGS